MIELAEELAGFAFCNAFVREGCFYSRLLLYSFIRDFHFLLLNMDATSVAGDATTK